MVLCYISDKCVVFRIIKFGFISIGDQHDRMTLAFIQVFRWPYVQAKSAAWIIYICFVKREYVFSRVPLFQVEFWWRKTSESFWWLPYCFINRVPSKSTTSDINVTSTINAFWLFEYVVLKQKFMLIRKFSWYPCIS